MEDRIVFPPRKVSTSVPGNCEYVLWHGKGGSKVKGGTEVASELTMRWEIILAI